MNKNIFKSASVLTFAFLVLAGCGKVPTASKGSTSESDEALITGLEDFNSIEIHAASGNITLTEGEEFSVSYYLHANEEVVINEVRDGKFIFDTKFERNNKINPGDYYVDITIPAGHRLEEINLNSASGDIVLKAESFEEAELKTVSGSVFAENAVCESIEAETTSGKISLKNITADDADAKNVSGNISIDGKFQEADAKTVSGDIEITGEIKNEADAETVSGNITTDFPLSSVEASTVGKITYMGNQQGKKINIINGTPLLEAKSVSGNIKIN